MKDAIKHALESLFDDSMTSEVIDMADSDNDVKDLLENESLRSLTITIGIPERREHRRKRREHHKPKRDDIIELDDDDDDEINL